MDWEEPSPYNEDEFVKDWEEEMSDACFELFSPRPESNLQLTMVWSCLI
jgi:hypothetical protein